MGHKRKRKPKPKRQVRCTLCTKYRWLGNTKERRPSRDRRDTQDSVRKLIEEAA